MKTKLRMQPLDLFLTGVLIAGLVLIGGTHSKGDIWTWIAAEDAADQSRRAAKATEELNQRLAAAAQAPTAVDQGTISNLLERVAKLQLRLEKLEAQNLPSRVKHLEDKNHPLPEAYEK